ncbi:MAG: hypothetical protein IKZ45_03245 [Fibrobacter sp.]|nr:hypothetical protein [Fibrobacter sp.]
MDTKKMHLIAIAVTLGAAIFPLPAHPADITEAQVFEWWDDGTIEADEANEMLTLLDEGRMQEACALAEIYANEPCETDTRAPLEDGEFAGNNTAGSKTAGKNTAGSKNAHKPSRSNPAGTRTRSKKTPRHYSGHLSSKVRFDSAGNVTAHRKELLFNFHRATLRLGSQELLTYKGKRGEAHFGQISTRELHSAIPLDTLWGTAVAASFKHFQPSILLDTSGTASAQIAITPFKKFSASAAYWYGDSGHVHSTKKHSASLSLAFPSGLIATWYQPGEPTPLIHFRLHGRDSSTISWRTTGYVHGDSIPLQAWLSPSIATRRFWTTQNISIRAKDPLNTRISTSARILSPLHSDSISGRLALDAESGPPAIRIGAKITCKEASENCRQTIYQGGARATRDFGTLSAALSGSARTQHDRADASWSRPRLEIGASVYESAPGKKNQFKLSLVAPDALPHENLQIRSETRLAGEFLEFSLIATFKKTGRGKVRPAHAQIASKIFF